MRRERKKNEMDIGFFSSSGKSLKCLGHLPFLVFVVFDLKCH